MAVNDTIKEADYNNIRNKVISVLGSGSADYGWGQTLLSSAVATGNNVTVNEWGRLRYDIINAYTHIYGYAPTPVQVASGESIRYNVSDAPVTTYDTFANLIVANRFTVHSSQASEAVATPTSTTWPGLYGSYWTSKIQCIVTATWTTASAARYFFNSGGQIRLSANQSGGSGTSQITNWRSLLSSSGIQQFGGNNPGTGTSPANGLNWYRLSSSFQVWYSASGSSPYGSNTYRISARTPGVVNNSTGTATYAEFLIEFLDGYVDPDTAAGRSELLNPPGDRVDGTFEVNASALYATGILVPTGTGNFTVTKPTLSLGAVTT